MKHARFLKLLFRSQLGPVFALLFIVVLFGVADSVWSGGKFLTAYNMRVVMDTAARITVPALGMTIIIIAAGIDLSAGTALTLCGTVLATQLKYSSVAVGEPGFAWFMTQALVLTVLTGCICGLINGMLISLTKVVPFIVTLGTMTIFLGIGQIIAKESTVYADAKFRPTWLADFCYTGSNSDRYFNFGFLPNLPTSVLVMIVLVIAVGVLLRYTVFGRNIFAIGSSESTARLCGVNVPLTTLMIYTLAGVFTAIGGIMYYANVNNGNPSDGMGKELEIIAAVVLGGGSLSGGRGSVVGTMIGALIIAVISSGCTQLDIPNTYTHIIIGGIIIIAVILDQLRHGSPEWFFRMLANGEPGNDVRVIANCQKVLLICVLSYIILEIGLIVVPSPAYFLLFIMILLTKSVFTVFLYILCGEVFRSRNGFLLGILGILPGIGAIVAMWAGIRSTRILRSKGIRVGLFGSFDDKGGVN